MIEVIHNLTPTNLEFLASVVGDAHISVKGADLDQHASDESFHKAHRPAAVVWPASAEEVSAILEYANRERIPVTPWGAGTSLEGNPIPLYGGIVLDMARMDKILKVHPEDFQVDVQAGVLYKDMNAVLGKQGIFFAPVPGANASIGGMIANNAAGTRTLKYGATKANALRLEVVLPSGEIIRAGTRSSKTASGYDLVRLFVGSEGTLGVVTEATLRLAPLPEKFSSAIAAFPTSDAATQTVSNIIGTGLTPAALEYIGLATVQAIIASGEFELSEYPTLLIEFHNTTDAGLKEDMAEIEFIFNEAGCINFEFGLGRRERDRLWQVRHQAYEILLRANPGRSFLIGDVAVPVSAYSQLVEAASKALLERDLRGYFAGHAGDGNLHPLISYVPGNPENYAQARAANKAIVEAAIAMGGTATGEHGVGIGKRKFMELEHGESLNLMRAIKDAFDPNGILNPGKIFNHP